MVKRYTPTAKTSYAYCGDNSDEAVVSLKKDAKGEYVKYEAYRSLETKYNKLFYGKECVRIAKRAGLSPEEIQCRVKDFCSDHYKHFGCYPFDMEVAENIVINFETMMDIISYQDE